MRSDPVSQLFHRAERGQPWLHVGAQTPAGLADTGAIVVWHVLTPEQRP